MFYLSTTQVQPKVEKEILDKIVMVEATLSFVKKVWRTCALKNCSCAVRALHGFPCSLLSLLTPVALQPADFMPGWQVEEDIKTYYETVVLKVRIS